MKNRGKYIARMDADDISLPDRFKKQVEFLEKHEDISLVGSWFVIFPQNILRCFSEKNNIFRFVERMLYCSPNGNV